MVSADVMIDLPMPQPTPEHAPTPELSPQRRKLVMQAIDTWKRDLLDTTARNNLIYYRDLATGTLAFDGIESQVDNLLSKGQLRLSKAFKRSGVTRSFSKQAKSIYSTAKSNFEEKGVETMFLGIGLATWDESQPKSRPPSAPVILLPVSLEQTGVGSSDFYLNVIGDAHFNPSLARRLNSDYSLGLNAGELDRQIVALNTITDCWSFCDDLIASAALVSNFQVDRKVVLGNFSYNKLSMVVDLDNAGEEMIGHDLIAAVCGDPDADAAVRAKNNSCSIVDISDLDKVDPKGEFLVLDADASQSKAINTVLSGRDLVIQGPPGTGKSQTIANLIAALIAENKTVLFVAEKRAAIDAVFSRLRRVGLDHLLLDMHNGLHKKKSSFAQDINEAIQKHREILSESQTDPTAQNNISISNMQGSLMDTRTALNKYSQAQSQIYEPWGLSMNQLLTDLIPLLSEIKSQIRYDSKEIVEINNQRKADIDRLLDSWFQKGGQQSPVGASPWHSLSLLDLQQARVLSQEISNWRTDLMHLMNYTRQAAAYLGFISPLSLNDTYIQADVMQRTNIALSYFQPEVFYEDLGAIKELLSPWRDGGMRRLKAQVSSEDYRKAQKLFKAHLTELGKTLSKEALLDQLDQLLDIKYRWDALSNGRSAPSPYPQLEGLTHLLPRVWQEWSNLQECFDGPEGMFAFHNSMDRALEQLEAILRDSSIVPAVVEINQIEQKIDELTFGRILNYVRSNRLNESQIQQFSNFVWLHSIFDYLIWQNPAIMPVTGPTALVDSFMKLDKEHILSGTERIKTIAAQNADNVITQNQLQAKVIDDQVTLKPRSPRRIPVRDFFDQATNVLQAVKPCWAMSPLVVSQALPAQRDLFDVVIFDEASQVAPSDAMLSILRGKQTVVSGDSNQLPPTAFFVNNNEEPVDLDQGDPVVSSQDIESILNQLTSILPEEMLLWHYRSHDEKLIAFSNTYIYNSALITFPGISIDSVISHQLVPVTRIPASQAEGDNVAEAERVIDLIMDHIDQRPNESLGVIAMGVGYSNLINELWDKKLSDLRNNPPSNWSDRKQENLDNFLDPNRGEPFFIKNLERVQGDERDSIILTIGYSPNPHTGAMRYNFGPINKPGGERRLNVAVTRAKRHMTVVSSFSSKDMDPAKLNDKGPVFLKNYLSYAESNGTNLGQLTRKPPRLNPFEIQIQRELEKAGLDLTPQYGVSGYFIDFAVKHPNKPGQYLLAVECDGATYHSSPTARARDRLRQQHLENLGWEFSRIWSTDWFRDPEAQVQKVLNDYQAALIKNP